MPSLNKIYQQIVDSTMAAISHPLRGVITAVPNQDHNNVPWEYGAQCVDVRVAGSGSSFPRTYHDVPWNGIGGAPGVWNGKPTVGDYVDIVFKGGHSEFPVVVGSHRGPGASAEAQAANSPQASVPTGATIDGCQAGPDGTGVRTVNQNTINLLKKLEGFAQVAVMDTNKLEIGYGHDSSKSYPVVAGQSITIPQAELLLQQDLLIARKVVKRYVTCPLNNNQFGALVSIAYNTGGGNVFPIRCQTALALALQQKNYAAAAAAILKTNTYDAKHGSHKGLLSRRQQEAALFLAPDPSPPS